MSDGLDQAQAAFHVSAIWDEEAGVFFSQSDIPGLHVEAETFEAFVTLVHALAPEMIADNTALGGKPVAIQIVARRDVVLSAA